VRGVGPDDIAALGGREAVATRFDAHVAGETRGDRSAHFTLSPSSASRVAAGDRLVLPSLNGGRLTTACAHAPFALVGGLRNGAAVGRFVAAARRLDLVDRVTIVAAGERWKPDWAGDERSRFAIEDWLGAGAIAAECRAHGVHLSAEAETAARAFTAIGTDLDAVLAESVTGRELRDAGFGDDVVLAAEVAVDDGVPALNGDGFVERLPFTWRPATEGDRSYLFELKRATMRDYIASAFGGWNERDQRTTFDPDLARTAILAVDGREAGMVEARLDRDGLYLANIEIGPEHQGRGLGARVMTVLATAAHARGLPLVLQVLKTNPRARGFYERFGLRVTGESSYHWPMELAPRG
jgi:2-phosphosulfolactate phosphatase